MDKRVFRRTLVDLLFRMFASVATVALVVIFIAAGNSYEWYMRILSFVVCGNAATVFFESLQRIVSVLKVYVSHPESNYSSEGTIELVIEDYKSYPKK